VRWAGTTAALVALAQSSRALQYSRVIARDRRRLHLEKASRCFFRNLSRDPRNAYFSEGIQDEILTRLAKIAEPEGNLTHLDAAFRVTR